MAAIKYPNLAGPDDGWISYVSYMKPSKKDANDAMIVEMKKNIATAMP